MMEVLIMMIMMIMMIIMLRAPQFWGNEYLLPGDDDKDDGDDDNDENPNPTTVSNRK